MTGLVEVKDHVIWLAHIKNDDALVTYLDSIRQGIQVNLTVDGVTGTWEKMQDAHKGVATRGIKPVGEAKTAWADVYKSKAGQIVKISKS